MEYGVMVFFADGSVEAMEYLDQAQAKAVSSAYLDQQQVVELNTYIMNLAPEGVTLH